MNEENRHILISRQREKATLMLSQADEMLSLKHWDIAANRYYYACFHVVQGLFILKGISAHKHSGVISQFSLHFVKTGLVKITYGSFLARMMQLRQKADYNCSYSITEEEVREIATLAHEFVCEVDKIIIE